ncbi:MAG: hypothetical protein KDC12_02615 [Flavobacteriales bacterium]|nr:hypothetical protein [Flavobacteriales bacterium]
MKAIQNILASLCVVAGLSASAQCDSIANWCSHNMPDEYISDGQMYRALLYHDQVAEFQMTMFGNSTYRIAGCSGAEDGNLIFRIYDEEKNLLFTNADHANAPYWDFVVGSTVNCTIEAQLDYNRRESGCAVLLIGFKQ